MAGGAAGDVKKMLHRRSRRSRRRLQIYLAGASVSGALLFLIKCRTALIRAKVCHREKGLVSLVSAIVVAIRDLYLIPLSTPRLQVILLASLRSNTVRNNKPLPPEFT